MIDLRTIKQLDERRQEILEAAIKLFSEKGYDKTSISDIAAYLKISQGLCYRYFKSKEEIFEKALDEYANSIADGMIKIISSPELSIEDKLARKAKFHSLEKKSSYYDIFHGENAKPLHDRLSMSICRKVFPYVQAEIEKEVKSGRLKVKDPAMLASCCVYGQFGILFDENTDAALRAKRINEFLIDMLERYKV